ncbi:hypothetical protein [Okeania sp. SIO2B3]|uniref:hypothetical protein n=1 Tax=Okeania sp. SIO2B3 TaxID=2607784 RepID=UPI0013C1C5A6|nr:hypothetical protein [Okeania sp. SIO2B3]NET47067.1 hypothetical protein [Okeania sp. SIO2B3]
MLWLSKSIIYLLEGPNLQVLKVDYHAYIQSPQWKAKGKIFKKKVGDRCQVFPWIQLTTYAIHHCTYKNLGDEKWNIDCIVLSKTAHAIVHSWLAGSVYPIGVSEQEKKGSKYPNLFQRAFHLYARLIGLLLYILR